jgi:hypothetical protein
LKLDRRFVQLSPRWEEAMQHDDILKADLLSEVLLVSSGAILFLLLIAFFVVAIVSSILS